MNHGFPFRGYRGAVKDSLWLRLAFWLYAIGIEVRKRYDERIRAQ